MDSEEKKKGEEMEEEIEKGDPYEEPRNPKPTKGIRKGAKKIDKKEDPIDLLIAHDKTLARRDAEAKLQKIRTKRANYKRIFVFGETSEDSEEYKKWFNPELSHCYFAMYARHKTCYRKGD